MLSITTDFTKLTLKFQGLREETANVVAAIVEEEFESMLKNAPQYSGNFVANMKLRAGGAVGGGDKEEFPQGQDILQVFQRGNQPAIDRALQNNAGFRQQATGRIKGTSGWIANMTIYNPWHKAELIEGLDDSDLRMGRAHPITKLKAALQARANTAVNYGSTEWYRLLSRAPL